MKSADRPLNTMPPLGDPESSLTSTVLHSITPSVKIITKTNH